MTGSQNEQDHQTKIKNSQFQKQCERIRKSKEVSNTSENALDHDKNTKHETELNKIWPRR